MLLIPLIGLPNESSKIKAKANKKNNLILPLQKIADSVFVPYCTEESVNNVYSNSNSFKLANSGLSIFISRVKKEAKTNIDSFSSALLGPKAQAEQKSKACILPLIVNLDKAQPSKELDLSSMEVALGDKESIFCSNSKAYLTKDRIKYYSAELVLNNYSKQLSRKKIIVKLKKELAGLQKQNKPNLAKIREAKLSLKYNTFLLKDFSSLSKLFDSVCKNASAAATPFARTPATVAPTNKTSTPIVTTTATSVPTIISATSTPGVTPTSIISSFKKGDKVELIRRTNFRRTPELSGSLIQQLPAGSVGTIVGNTPIKNRTDNVIWREVDFGLAEKSFVGEDNLKAYQTPVACTNGETTQRIFYKEPKVEEGQVCISEDQSWKCEQNQWIRVNGSYQYQSCYVSEILPVRVPSYGPNGSHWPSLIETPFLYNKAAIDIEVEPRWDAISAAFTNLTASDVAQGVRILIKPGTLTGQGAGLENISVLKNIGSSNWSKRVLVAPLDGYGSVTINGGFKFTNVKGIAFAGLYSTGGFYCIDCDRSALAWTRLNGYSAIHAQTKGTQTSKFELSEVVWPNTRVSTADVLQLISNSGFLKDFKLSGLWMAPHYYEKDFRKKYPLAGDIPHMDTLQIYKENDGTYQGINITIQDSTIFASNNAALQTGGTDGIILDNTFLVGAGLSKATYPPPANGEDTSLFPAMNGIGSRWQVSDSLIFGGLDVTPKVGYSTQPFISVTNSTRNGSASSITTPKSGAWTFSSQMQTYSGKLMPKPTDSDLEILWKRSTS